MKLFAKYSCISLIGFLIKGIPIIVSNVDFDSLFKHTLYYQIRF
jgi:hypothetical protein